MNKLQIIWEGFLLVAFWALLWVVVIAFSPSARAEGYVPEKYQAMLNGVLEKQPVEWNLERQFTYKDIEDAFDSTPNLILRPDEFEYFATPLEFEANGGDCEDVSIWRAYELAKKGTGRLELYIGNQGYSSHAVLVATDDKGVQWVLDNLVRYPYKLKHLDMQVVYKLEII